MGARDAGREGRRLDELSRSSAALALRAGRHRRQAVRVGERDRLPRLGRLFARLALHDDGLGERFECRDHAVILHRRDRRKESAMLPRERLALRTLHLRDA